MTDVPNISECNAYTQVCTGALAGLVSITAGCGVVTTYSAFVCGVVAAPVVVYGEVLMEKLKIDDPVRALFLVEAA